MSAKLTVRQRQILSLLIERSGEVTAAEIAADTEVSVRTVHRELEGLGPVVEAAGAVLSKKSGKGIQLVADEKALAALRQLLDSRQAVEYSAEDRKMYALCMLLESEEPVKLFALAHSLKVTVATVSNDLDELEPWVRKFGLLLIRRRGYGVEIAGAEADKRRAVTRLAAEHLDLSDLVGRVRPQGDNPAAAAVLAAAGKHHLLDIENTLWDMNLPWTADLPEIAYMELLLALSVTLRRVELGAGIGSPSDCAYPVASDHRNIAGAEQFVGRLASELEIEFPRAEILYIAGLFDRIQDSFSSESLVYGDIGLMEIVYRLTENVVKRTGIPFQSDRHLREGLLEHLEPALRRIREGTRIRNPLLVPIRRDYAELFRIVREAVDELMTETAIPDEEIGFLVMHFGASAERLSQLNRHVRAVLVCASGLSSSRLLATRLAKEMPQIEVIGNASWYEAARMADTDYDLIISTIDLPLPSESYVKISPLLTPEESGKLLGFIQRMTLEGHEPGAVSEEQAHAPPAGGAAGKEGALERLRSHKAVLDEMVLLIDGFRCHSLDNTGMDLSGTLAEMLGRLEESSLGNAERIRELLLERERMASQVIPDTNLALFHTRSSQVHRSTLALYRLREPVVLEGNTPVGVLLLMLAPRKLSKESLEVLSEISAQLLDTELIRLLEEGTEQEIRGFWSAELLRYFENK